jgi:hypothetical protein
VNRNDEYLTLMNELENTPVQLEYAEKRAQARLKAEHRHRFFIVPLSSIAVFLTIFTILVNCFPTFAYACGRIPLIKELAKVVAFSQSLSAAVENQYVQPIEQEQTVNGITAKIAYVIVDQKQLNIFYSLDSDTYTSMFDYTEVKATDGTVLEGYCMSSGTPNTPNGKLRLMTLDFMDRDMPGSMLLTIKVHDNGSFTRTAPVHEKDSMLSDSEYKEPDYISKFTFTLEFDPYYTAQGENIILNHSFDLDGQNIVLDNAEIYPTHIRLNFSDKADNTAWLKSLSFYLENEKGKRFDKISNGLTATGSPDSPMMRSHRLESTFFSNSRELTLYIKGVQWLDKDMEKVMLDLKNVTAERLPQGVIFEKAERIKNDWILTFAAKIYKENTSYQLWSNNYYDEQGKEYTFNSWSSRESAYGVKELPNNTDAPDMFYVVIPLKEYPYDTVYMSPEFSRVVELSKPVVIKIK